jgi:hypothetical protein
MVLERCQSSAIINPDGIVKRPDAAFRFIPRRCGVRQSTPHFSGLVRLACGVFYETIPNSKLFKTFYEVVNPGCTNDGVAP